MTKDMERSATLPLPTHEKKLLIQAEINSDLCKSVKAEARKQKITLRAVAEYGLKRWLLDVNPSEAKRLGIIQED